MAVLQRSEEVRTHEADKKERFTFKNGEEITVNTLEIANELNGSGAYSLKDAGVGDNVRIPTPRNIDRASTHFLETAS